MIERMMRGFTPTVGAADLPGPGDPGLLSGSTGAYLGSIPLVPSRGVSRYATYRMIYLTNPWVWSAVNMISRGMARFPLHVFALDERARKSRVRGDIASPGRNSGGAQLDLLLSRPSTFSRFNFWKGTVQDRLLLGNGLWQIERDSITRQVTGLSRIRWRDVEDVDETDGIPNSYLVRRGTRGTSVVGSLSGRRERLLPADVVHFGLGSDSDSAVGISPLESCRYTLALHEAVMRHLVSYFGNAMRSSGHVKVPNLDRKKAEELRRMITEIYASPENAGKVLVTSGDWQSTSDSMAETEIVGLIKASREEIAAVYAVPPPVLGILDQAIKSNVKELREQWTRDSLGTWAPEFEDELSAQLLPQQPSWRSLFLEFQLAEQLRPDMEGRAEVFSKTKHVYTIDEQRAIENLPPLEIPGVTDVTWVDSGSVPATKAGQQFAGEVAAAVEERLVARLGLTLNGHHDEEEIPA